MQGRNFGLKSGVPIQDENESLLGAESSTPDKWVKQLQMI